MPPACLIVSASCFPAHACWGQGPRASCSGPPHPFRRPLCLAPSLTTFNCVKLHLTQVVWPISSLMPKATIAGSQAGSWGHVTDLVT
jgi:hypothetical protein